ncbi:MAG: phage recombination protein Bet [Bifidobacteriaceae bacterium]|jgi:phage recombination protein Bet|nr:phage recombination protein Bet [Bifidobacteriaceae bacterium]
MGSELTIEENQKGFTGAQLAALSHAGVQNAGQGDLEVFFHQVQRTGLDPFARQIYMIQRQGKQTIQVGIDGFRLIARRAADHSGEAFGEPETLWCGPDGVWSDVWLDPKLPPAAAKVVVQRGQGIFPAVALYSEYVGRKRDGHVNSMWASKPAIMLAKCAEALALRKAFPQDLSGLYTSDEMDQADNHAPARQATAPATQAKSAPHAPTKQQLVQVARLMQQGGVDTPEKAEAAFMALTGKAIHSTSQLDIADVEALLSAPQKVVDDTKAALAKVEAKATQAEEPAPAEEPPIETTVEPDEGFAAEETPEVVS